MKSKTIITLVGSIFQLAVVPTTQAQFTCTTNDGTITITGYTGASSSVTVPSVLNGLPVTCIGEYAFSGLYNAADVTSVSIPASVTSIQASAFYFAIYLIDVTTTNGLTSIGAGAFYGCTSLSSVNIPASVTSIAQDAPAIFYDCPNLTAIMVDTNNSAYSSLNGILFDKSQSTLIEYPDGLSGPYTVPVSVASIAEEAFVYCTKLTSITIPAGVISIGDYAFAECPALTNCYFQGNAPSADANIFYMDQNATVYYLAQTVGWGSLYAGVPAVLWNPSIQVESTSVGLRGNSFGFTITAAANIQVTVEVCTNLNNPVWLPLQTLTLTNGSAYFSEPLQPFLPLRLYRIWWP